MNEKVNVNDGKVNVNVTEKVNVNDGKVTEKVNVKVTENRTEANNWTENRIEASQKTEQKPNRNRTEKGFKLTETRIAILQLMKDDPYISKAEIAKLLELHPSAVSRNIEAMRGKYLRRVVPDKGGFWEIIV